MSVSRSDHLDWAIAGRPAQGEHDTGDIAAVEISGERCVLVVVDGLGHGPEAADAARKAVDAISHDPTLTPAALLEAAHRSLLDSRGAAATVAVVDGPSGELHWMGVGNVEAVVVRRDEETRPRNHGVFLRSGVLGRDLPQLRQPGPLVLQDRDRIALATDGIRVDLAEALQSDLAVDKLAEQILVDHATPSDDAVVLVACYRAPPGGTAGPSEQEGHAEGAGGAR